MELIRTENGNNIYQVEIKKNKYVVVQAKNEKEALRKAEAKRF